MKKFDNAKVAETITEYIATDFEAHKMSFDWKSGEDVLGLLQHLNEEEVMGFVFDQITNVMDSSEGNGTMALYQLDKIGRFVVLSFDVPSEYEDASDFMQYCANLYADVERIEEKVK